MTGYSLSTPERVTNYVSIPGRDGEIDLAYSLTGEPVFKSRKLTVALESSNGKRAYRESLLSDMLNRIEGRYLKIILPDDEMHYLNGSIHVTVKYSDTNHCAVEITAIVEPWREAVKPIYMDLTAKTAPQSVVIKNNGGRRVIPMVNAYAAGGLVPDITVTYGAWSAQPTADTIMPEELALGYLEEKIVTYSGSGQLVIRWQEADL